jgi:hypothetical protein
MRQIIPLNCAPHSEIFANMANESLTIPNMEWQMAQQTVQRV